MKKLQKTSYWLGVCLTVLLVAGCGDSAVGERREFTKNGHYCQSDTKEARAEFTLECIANANPKSDEEPEDWIRQCQGMAEETLCDLMPVLITEECVSSSFGTCGWWREVNRSIMSN